MNKGGIMLGCIKVLRFLVTPVTRASKRHGVDFFKDGTMPAVMSEINLADDQLRKIHEVERVYVQGREGSLSFLIVVPDKNLAVQDRVYAVESEVIDAFPHSDIDFDVVFRCGRPLEDIVSPKGTLLFAR